MYKEKYNKAMKVIEHSKKGYLDDYFFGKEIDHKFESMIASIYQNPDKDDKALKLRDRIIEGHPFMDGNHRIASLLYMTFKK
jgi:fido (protein-threonine AMPylation protein)